MNRKLGSKEPKNRQKLNYARGLMILQHIIANFLGKGFSALLALVFIPFYLSLVGVEGIGMIYFFNGLIALSHCLDFGLGATVNREMARLNAQEKKKIEIYSFVKQVEKKGFFLSFLYGVIILCSASFLAHHWLRFEILSSVEIKNSILLMGIALMFQWPLILYQHFLLGLEKQTMWNILFSGANLMRYGGAFICLKYISPTLFVFFIWQGFASVLQFILIRYLFFRSIPKEKASLERKEFKFFSLSMAGVSILGLLFAHMDKIVLSRLLSLEHFGLYSLGASLAVGLFSFVHPLFYAYLPRFTALHVQNKLGELKQLFIQAAGAAMGLLLILGTFLFFFSKQILLRWTGNEQISCQAEPCFRFLIMGYALFGISAIFSCLQVGIGREKDFLRQIACGLVVFVPTLFFFTLQSGLEGAGIAWVIATSVYTLIGAWKTLYHLSKITLHLST